MHRVQVDMTALDDEIWVMAFNDATDSRSFLTLAASCDGASWQRIAVLEDEPAGSFSYPTLQDLPDQVLRRALLAGSAAGVLWQDCSTLQLHMS